MHNAFLFANYQFTSYDKETVIERIKSNETISPYETYQMVEFIEQKISVMSLYPQYVIDDNMYQIWNYFFGMS